MLKPTKLAVKMKHYGRVEVPSQEEGQRGLRSIEKKERKFPDTDTWVLNCFRDKYDPCSSGSRMEPLDFHKKEEGGGGVGRGVGRRDFISRVMVTHL